MRKKFRYITLVFIVSFLIITGLCYYALKQYSSLVSYSDAVDHTNKVITRLYTVKDILHDFDGKEYEYIITKDTSYISGYQKNINKLYSMIDDLKGLMHDEKQQLNTLILLKSTFALRINYFKENVAFLDTNSIYNESVYYRDSYPKKQELYKYVDEIIERENRLLETRFNNKRYSEYITSHTTRFLLIFFLVTTLFLFVIMLYEFKQKIKYQNELQANLLDLKNSHSELKQIAFAASHDLKEPLRKIKILSDMLLTLTKSYDNNEVKAIVSKISGASDDVQELTNEIINLVNVIKDKNFESNQNLNDIIQDILNEKQEELTANDTVITVQLLPEITGDQVQLKILFSHLIENAMKFSKAGSRNNIQIVSETVSGDEIMDIDKNAEHKTFHRISVSDNGIGFDDIYTHKIFKAFQRLHNDQSVYKGKGIGLAVCRRIIINHQGYITASGHLGMGATFKLYFPANN